jgi:hypothetical protein
VYIKLVVLLRNYVTMMHGQQNIKNGWATIVVVGRLRVKNHKSANVRNFRQGETMHTKYKRLKLGDGQA